MSRPVAIKRCGTSMAPRGVLVGPPTEALRPHALCPCEPIELELSATSTVTIKAAAVALHAGLPIPDTRRMGSLVEVGELSGAMVMVSTFTQALVFGRSWPSGGKLYSWRNLPLGFFVGDTIELRANKPGTITLWPMMLASPFIRDEATLKARSLEEMK